MGGKLVVLVAGLAVVLTGRLAAQARPIELGIDAGFTTKLNDPKVSTIGFPIQQFRIGFFASDRVEIEPAVAFNWIKPSGEDAITTLTGNLGVLFHFTTDAAKARAYIRPFAGVEHLASGGSSATAFSLGGGIGVKLPVRTDSRFAVRLEAGYLHGFKHESDGIDASDRIQLLFGLSFLTK